MKIKSSKIFIVFVSVIFGIEAMPVRNGMMFYQAPSRFSRSGPYPYHQAMLVHYGQPRTNTQRSSEVAAFAAGDSVGTGSYLENAVDRHEYVSYEKEEPSSQSNNDNTIAIAEAYPQENNNIPSNNDVIPQPEVAPPLPNEDTSYDLNPAVQNENIDERPIVSSADSVVPAEVPQYTGQPAVMEDPKPIIPALIPTKKKKTRVDLDENEDSNDDYQPFTTKVQRPVNGGNMYPWPVNNFFPLNFGNTSGGAIAVANSFSTGKGGTATSHATAYGSSARQKDKRPQTYE